MITFRDQDGRRFDATAGDPPRCLLVSAPFGPLRTPSLALSILKSLALRTGVEARVWYSTLRYARLVGAEIYERLAEGAPSTTDLAGEWVFSPLRGARDDEEYLHTVILSRATVRRTSQKDDDSRLEQLAASLRELRAGVRAFIEDEADAIAACDPTIVGFTSVFQQTMASVAIAEALKRRRADVLVVFGGANCESPMGLELLKHHACIDAVVSGEGEHDFERLLTRLDGRAMPAVPAPTKTLQMLSPTDVHEQFVKLDELPVPEFDDYFEQLEQTNGAFTFEPHLLYEASRGCWWGAKTHCTFCGLNGGAMAFRSKAAPKVLSELRALLDRHGRLPVDFVDNILGLDYLETLLPVLAQDPDRVPLFFETKANLKRAQVELLKRAGVAIIQPGIESLSDNVLRIMGKGVRAIQNIQLLKWCAEFDIEPNWNWLWGFPGEDPAEYDALAAWAPLLEHLRPPTVGSAIRLDRYSPLFERSGSFGLSRVRPYPAYGLVYRDYDAEALDRVAYYFTFDYDEPRDVTGYTEGLAGAIQAWQENARGADLVSAGLGPYLWIWDTRASAKRPVVVLDGLHRLVYDACSSATHFDAVVTACNGYDRSTVDEVVGQLSDAGLLLRIAPACLALALPLETYEPQGKKLARLVETMRQTADHTDDGELRFTPATHLFASSYATA